MNVLAVFVSFYLKEKKIFVIYLFIIHFLKRFSKLFYRVW